MATSVLKFTCPHVAHACYNMSISLPVVQETSSRLSMKVCPSCASAKVGQVSEQLENTCRLLTTGKSASEYSDSPTSWEGIE